MPDHFMTLSAADRLNALAVASEQSQRSLHLLEKDVWVVWALETLFTSPLGNHLVFKGGTSLSKAYGVIHRFSEDIDLTYDIRTIAGDLIADTVNALPPNRSQEKKWSKAIQERLTGWIQSEALPIIESSLQQIHIQSNAYADQEKIYIEYSPVATGTGYVRPSVMLEFGARSTGEPWEIRPVTCDVAALLPQLTFPAAYPRVMRAERTFWEKATAIHVFCMQGRFRGTDRFSRHWHDLVRLDDAGYTTRAIENHEIAHAVARHKTMFFAEHDANGIPIDYQKAVSGDLHLVPGGSIRTLLAKDYQQMIDDGLLLNDVESFDALLEHCRIMEERVNSRNKV